MLILYQLQFDILIIPQMVSKKREEKKKKVLVYKLACFHILK